MQKTWTLSNGVRVVAESMPEMRSVSVNVWMHTGSMMETEAENGISHFLEHMAFKGTARRTNRELAREMDAMGGHFNAYTARDCTCYYARVIDEDLEKAMDVLSDISIRAAMDPEEMEKERGVVLEEIAMDEDSPEDLVGDILHQSQFEGTSAGRPILGTSAHVSAYTRQDLLGYRDSHYTPQSCVVGVCGHYDEERLRALLETYFGSWQREGVAPHIGLWEAQNGKLITREKDVEQLHLSLGYPGLAYGDGDIYALATLSSVLGGSMSSRLFQRVREELGMAYTVYSYADSFEGGGAFAVYAAVSPKNGRQVLDEILSQVALMRRDGLQEREFLEAKNQLRISYLLGLESPSGRISAWGRQLMMLGRAIDNEETLAHIDSLTLEQVNAMARRVLSAQPSLAVVGRGADSYREVRA